MAAPVLLHRSTWTLGIRGILRFFARPGWIAALVTAAALGSGIATYLAMTGKGPFEKTNPDVILSLLLLCFVLGIVLAVLVVWRVARLIVARRTHSAGARLHTQMVMLFSLVAGAPMILVAVFSAITLNLVVESWFTERVQTAINSAVRVADVYVNAHKQTIERDLVNLVDVLGTVDMNQRDARVRLAEIMRVQGQLMGLSSIYLISDGAEVGHDFRPGVRMDMPPMEVLVGLESGRVAILTDPQSDQVRAIAQVPWLPGGYLYIGRTVNPETLAYQQQTRDAVAAYRTLESNRYNIQVGFVFIYFVVTVLLILAAMWLGLTFANRIAQPIGRLIGASERVSSGDLSARVDVGRTRDEIEVLGRAFNRMTGQLQSQRNELIEANRQVDERRQFTEAVLSGVSAGVLGVDNNGMITVANSSALRLLRVSQDDLLGLPLVKAVPSFGELAAKAWAGGGRSRGQVDLMGDDGERRVNVQITADTPIGGDARLIVTFDDITDLVAAQRTAAWADVARRIAHEIKNPLTPIQLSAERLRRKYKKEIRTDPDTFDQCTDTIIRHVSDIGRMVDEFSAFARMPEPIFHDVDLKDLLRQAAFSQKVAVPHIKIDVNLPGHDIVVACDGRLMAQVFANALKNASEAIGDKREIEGEAMEPGAIRVGLTVEDNYAVITIADNGGGWPRALRGRLTEPYVTTRKKGTGLGLAIVNKVIEEHGGKLTLADCTEGGQVCEGEVGSEISISGAALVMRLPLVRNKAILNHAAVDTDGFSMREHLPTELRS